MYRLNLTFFCNYIFACFVSIHHMYRLNRRFFPLLLVLAGFNTSYVSVELMLLPISPKTLISFNTSYVSVELPFGILSLLIFHVSIHHMYRLNLFDRTAKKQRKHVSIHHMYRLNKRDRLFISELFYVSIHHMYRLNHSSYPKCFSFFEVSIHHMYRLN